MNVACFLIAFGVANALTAFQGPLTRSRSKRGLAAVQNEGQEIKRANTQVLEYDNAQEQDEEYKVCLPCGHSHPATSEFDCKCPTCTKCFSYEQDGKMVSKDCPICAETFDSHECKLQTAPCCGHELCLNCAIKSDSKCPFCRKLFDIDEDANEITISSDKELTIREFGIPQRLPAEAAEDGRIHLMHMDVAGRNPLLQIGGRAVQLEVKGDELVPKAHGFVSDGFGFMTPWKGIRDFFEAPLPEQLVLRVLSRRINDVEGHFNNDEGPAHPDPITEFFAELEARRLEEHFDDEMEEYEPQSPNEEYDWEAAMLEEQAALHNCSGAEEEEEEDSTSDEGGMDVEEDSDPEEPEDEPEPENTMDDADENGEYHYGLRRGN